MTSRQWLYSFPLIIVSIALFWFPWPKLPDRKPEIDFEAAAAKVAEGGQKLWNIYEKDLLLAETRSKFLQFYDKQHVTREELVAKPQVLLLGSFSTGKTSFIQWVTGKDSRHFHIGPDPTTDFFMAVTSPLQKSPVGSGLMGGHSATADHRLPYKGLQKFSQKFLDSFRVLEMDAPILRGLTFIDTPGIQAQTGTDKLGYSRVNVTEWFAERADLIYVMFDPEKTTISDELNRLLQVLQPFKSKVRYVLNKADRRDIDTAKLINVYGAILHKVGIVLRTEEKPRIAITSLKPWWRYESWWHSKILEDHKEIVKQELNDLPLMSALAARREMLIHRTRMVAAHWQLLAYFRDQIPLSSRMAGSGIGWICDHLEELMKSSAEAGVAGDNLPRIHLDSFRAKLREMDVSELHYNDPEIMRTFSQLPDKIQETSMDPE